MKTVSKVVGNLRIFACQIQPNLVSCEAHYDTDLNTRSTGFKEIIFKTNNIKLALNTYIKMLERGEVGRDV